MDIFCWPCVSGSSNVYARDLQDPVKLESCISQKLTGVWIVSASKNSVFYNKLWVNEMWLNTNVSMLVL